MSIDWLSCSYTGRSFTREQRRGDYPWTRCTALGACREIGLRGQGRCFMQRRLSCMAGLAASSVLAPRRTTFDARTVSLTSSATFLGGSLWSRNPIGSVHAAVSEHPWVPRSWLLRSLAHAFARERGSRKLAPGAGRARGCAMPARLTGCHYFGAVAELGRNGVALTTARVYLDDFLVPRPPTRTEAGAAGIVRRLRVGYLTLCTLEAALTPLCACCRTPMTWPQPEPCPPGPRFCEA
jgi:hypothetical protein